MLTKEDVSRACVDATLWHNGQYRKYTGLPYIVHPMAVMSLVRMVTDDPATLIGALFHDVVEDDMADISMIDEAYEKEVGDIVDWLDNSSISKDLSREDQKSIERAEIRVAPESVHNIRLADIIDNLSTITDYDVKFAKTYVNEKKLLIPMLHRGSNLLKTIALQKVEQAYVEIRAEEYFERQEKYPVSDPWFPDLGETLTQL